MTPAGLIPFLRVVIIAICQNVMIIIRQNYFHGYGSSPEGRRRILGGVEHIKSSHDVISGK